MSRTRIISIIAGVALALIGIIGLVAYVNAAEERAASGEERLEVWVADRRIPAGTRAARIGDMASLVDVPAKLTTESSVAALDDLGDLVLSEPILEGEVISLDRFTTATEFARDADRLVDVPEGLHEITMSLEPERAGGGLLQPGDVVGVLLSFTPAEIPGDLPREVDGEVILPGTTTWSTTKLNIVDVLVTNVQLEEVPEVVEREGVGEEEDVDIRLVPSGNLLVTLAADSVDAERIIFGAEFGNVWLTNQNGASEGPSIIQNRERIYIERDRLLEEFEAGDIDRGSAGAGYLASTDTDADSADQTDENQGEAAG